MRNFVFCAFFALFLLIPTVSPGVEPLAGDQTDGICKSIRESITDGKDSKVVVRTAIELGHNACLIVQCALAGGGEPERVISGAVEAGTRDDILSRCAIDGGLDPARVAAILNSTEVGLSLCYFEAKGPEHKGPEYEVLRRDPFPQEIEQRGKTIISPFTFE